MDSRIIPHNKKEINNIKSDFFLQKLFGYLPQIKSLEIIKLNKKIQKRINVDINDYKNYSEILNTNRNRNNT